MSPPRYPRIPYLVRPPRVSSADRVIPAGEVSGWWNVPVHVEEKVDGANVSLWYDDGVVQVASRGGSGSMDRGGQLGRLHAWAGNNSVGLVELLRNGWVVYGEWLWLRHGVAYDRLPDLLIVLDLWNPDEGMATVDDRDARCRSAGFATPPLRHRGPLTGPRELMDLLGRSDYTSSAAAEGLIIRRDGDGARCKVVDPEHRRPTDAELRTRQHNVVVPSWRGPEP